MTVADVASLLAAIAFLLLVGALAVPLFKLGRVFDETRELIKEVTDHSLPILDEAANTIVETNAQLGKIDTITTSAAQVSENISALSGLYSSVLGSPLIKVASFVYGVQHASARAFARAMGRTPDDDTPGDGPHLRPERDTRPGWGTSDGSRGARTGRTNS